MIPHFSRGRWSERSDVASSATMVSASSPRSIPEVSSFVRSRRRRSIFSAYDTPADRTGGTGCGRSSVPSCRATRSPWSCRPPTSWGDVDDVVSTDNREVHLSLGLIVLHFLRVAPATLDDECRGDTREDDQEGDQSDRKQERILENRRFRPAPLEREVPRTARCLGDERDKVGCRPREIECFRLSRGENGIES